MKLKMAPPTSPTREATREEVLSLTERALKRLGVPSPRWKARQAIGKVVFPQKYGMATFHAVCREFLDRGYEVPDYESPTMLERVVEHIAENAPETVSWV